ncbi:MAG: leucine-rich repeat domain-containing protein [Paludibacteraceae bacterium]|nr:leucine-rich repeat domain-containing protein [Paludibacteraceae bacterium]
MKKSLLTFVTTLSFCISVFAGTGMYVKLKNGEVAKYKVDDVEEVVFDELQEADSLLKFTIQSNNTVSVRCGVKPENLKGDIVIPSKVEIDGKIYNVTSIEEYAFTECNNMTSITIPASITSVGFGVFNGCLGLTNVEIPSSITRIEGQMFGWCPNLTSVKIPTSVTSIGDRAFRECIKLNSLEIPSSVTDFGVEAFYNSHADLIIDNSEENVKVGSYAFGGCHSVTWKGVILDKEETGLQFEVSGSNATVVKGDYSKLESVIIPSKVKINDKVYAVAGIANNAFINCKSLTYVKVSGGVTNMGVATFSGCENLETVVLGDGIKKISNSLFKGCASLSDINIPASVTEIDESAFEGCASLTSIDIPANVTNIVEYAFYGCKNLASIKVDDKNTTYSSVDGVLYNKEKTILIQVPGKIQGKFTILFGVTNIASGAFGSCEGLTGVKIQNTVTNISEFAFENCTGLTNVTIPSSVKNIDTKAFSGCKNLDLVISNAKENVTIESGALDDCKSVTWDFLVDESESPLKFKILTDSTAEVTEKNSVTGSVTIPSKVIIDGKRYSVVSITDNAFKNCKGLTNITIPSSVVNIGTDAFANSGLTTIELPSSITSIGFGLFLACSDLVSVKIPLSVESIGESAFVDCTSLTNLELSSSVKTIGVMAFYGCKNLDLVIDNSEDNVEVRPQAFQNCKSVTWKK